MRGPWGMDGIIVRSESLILRSGIAAQYHKLPTPVLLALDVVTVRLFSDTEALHISFCFALDEMDVNIWYRYHAYLDKLLYA